MGSRGRRACLRALFRYVSSQYTHHLLSKRSSHLASNLAAAEKPSWVTLPDLAASHPLHAGALLPQPRIKNVYMEPFYAALYPMQFRASLKDVFCKAERMGILVRRSELCGGERGGMDADTRTPRAVCERRRGGNARLVGRFRKLPENGASISVYLMEVADLSYAHAYPPVLGHSTPVTLLPRAIFLSSPPATLLFARQPTFKHAYIRMLGYGVIDAESSAAALRETCRGSAGVNGALIPTHYGPRLTLASC